MRKYVPSPSSVVSGSVSEKWLGEGAPASKRLSAIELLRFMLIAREGDRRKPGSALSAIHTILE
jgi:hypothetical protein